MFCLKVLRFNRFNKLVLNTTKLNSINTKYISNSLNSRRNIEENVKTLANISLDTDFKPKRKSNRFLDDIDFRKDILQDINQQNNRRKWSTN